MSTSKRSGAKITVYKGELGALLIGAGSNTLAANTYYTIAEKAATSSGLPSEFPIGFTFCTPDVSSVGATITLAVGDKVYPVGDQQLCKTDCEYSIEEGVIDTTDDCDFGYVTEIPDGFVKISGSINGHMRFLDSNGELASVVDSIMGRFLDIVTDDGAGDYTLAPKNNAKFVIRITLNNDAKVGDVKNEIIMQAYFTTVGSGAGLKDILKMDLSWVKANGPAIQYKRVVKAGDM